MFLNIFNRKQTLRKQSEKFILLFGVFFLSALYYYNESFADNPHTLFANIQVTLPETSIPYNRNQYRYGIDEDDDGFDTRAELLMEKSLVTVLFDVNNQKRIKSGKWFDPYTGVTFYNADAVDIDHLVPLYEVHVSGGYAWSDEKKRAYANDLSETGPLRITHRWTNRIPKSADDPSEYKPSFVPGRCQYLYDWVAIKRKWNLTMDPNEAYAIEKQLIACH